MKRRDLIAYLSATPLLGALGGITGRKLVEAPAKRDLLKELGIRTFINAAGTYTAMTATLMETPTLEAIRQAANHFCMLDEVQDKVGARIAQITHAEAAVVTSGAFSALTLGMAGILTGKDPEKVKRLPHLEGSGMKSEVICQKGHNIGYNQALKNCGVKIVMVETADEVRRAFNSNTAGMFYVHINSDQGKIQHEGWVALGKELGVPTFIDMAADVPPVSNLWRFNDMGFDFVVVSGGKAMRGPQSAGLLMGKKHIIEAARLSMPPRGETIGRGMKVNKEEVLGMLVALEQFVKKDHDALAKVYQKRIDLIKAAADSVKGTITKVSMPTLGNCTPTLNITWDKNVIKKDGAALREDLRFGTPSIEVVGGPDNIGITAWCLKEGEEKFVAKRIREIFEKASAA